MSQTTYTVGIFGSDNSLLYSGQLLVQLSPQTGMPSATMNAEAGLFSLKSFEPLLLGTLSAGAGGWGWSFVSGDNADLAVSTASLYSLDSGTSPVPSKIGGFVALSVSGQPEQYLPVLGFTGASAAPAFAPAGAAAQAEASHAQKLAAAQATAPDSYDYRLTLLDGSFAPTGATGRLQATGQWERFGVVGRRYVVNGTLTLDRPAQSFPVSGSGYSPMWLDGTAGNDTVQLILATGGSVADGVITLDGKQFYVVGGPPASGAQATAAAKSVKSSSPGKSSSSGKSPSLSKPSSAGKPGGKPGKSASSGKSSSPDKSASSGKSSRGGGKRGR